MTQDEIIEMAKQAGMDYLKYISPEAFEKVTVFANLVAQHEREACAVACEEVYTGEEASCDWPTPEMCATAIRARGQA